MRRRITAAAVTTALLGALLLPGGAQADPVAGSLSAQDTADCVLNPALPKRQFRAMWIASVVNIDWPGGPGRAEEALKAEYRGWLDLAQRLNHNAVVVQVRPTADAFWPSPYEPWSEWLTGARDGNGPGWDPLAFLVSEAHARNLEFHAWFNPYRVSMPQGAGADPNLLAPNHPVRQHPEWALAYPVNAAGSRLYYNPGIPAVRAFVQDAIMDAVDKYDIDGVHFDDYFYPYPAAGQDFPDQATFAEYGADFATKADWRRHNIDLLIQELSGRIKASKPWVKFGVSPFGIWRNKAADPLGSETNGTQSYDANFADTRKWVKEGWLDYIVPQVYWSIGFAVADYAKLVPWWSDVVSGTNTQLYVGQADYKINLAGQPAAWFDPNEMSKHITFNRDYNVAGNVHFSAKDVKANRLGATDIVAAEQYSKPALVPTMAQLPAKPLMFPVVTSATRQSDGIDLAWRPIADGLGPFGQAASYAVYRFDGFQPRLGACDLADATHLITTTRGTSFTDTTAVAGQRYTYYVTSVDRLWNESPASPPRLVP
ncbi:glycoside hydrolase family 10 protein [Catellatospora tritici]|uniref:glycoside hydrolase family 10 protein n=1 Tax=Catellatospora tritici TaxID=2851566 RepID=UPI001C2D0877|nr:family 10 glycosylhydrolase [Catellatospora tritici]MBV1852875.1 family 10 glycosylhydrolase [Catellatospora tritici]